LTEPSVQKEISSVPPPGTAISEDVRYLRNEEFAQWDAFVDASPQASLFARSWWLQAIGGDTRVLACFKNGRIAAGIPLHFERYWGITICRMPKITPRWGVLLPPQKGKSATIAATENGLLTTMAKALQKERFFFQLFSAELDNWLPFRWQGFSQTTRYTYQTSVQDIDQVWQNMTHNVRNQIGCAKRLGITVAPCGPDQLFELEEETYHRQGLHMPHTREYLKRLVSASEERNSGECLAATDPAGKVHGASFYVWDTHTTSALILGINSELRTSGAASLLHWSMLQSAAQKSKVYDFCGSVVEGIERFVRSFGGTRVPYHQITRFPRLASAYLAFKGKI
jgi:hypothetical protein